MFAFTNRRRDRIKLLLWDRNGFWLLMKRLEQDRFAWPKQEAVMTLTIEQLHWLLDRIDLSAMRRHPTSAICFSMKPRPRLDLARPGKAFRRRPQFAQGRR